MTGVQTCALPICFPVTIYVAVPGAIALLDDIKGEDWETNVLLDCNEAEVIPNDIAYPVGEVCSTSAENVYSKGIDLMYVVS